MKLHIGAGVPALALAVMVTVSPAAASSELAAGAPVVNTVLAPSAEPGQWGGTGYPWAGGYPGPLGYADPSVGSWAAWGAQSAGPWYGGGQTWGGWAAPWASGFGTPWLGYPPPPPFIGGVPPIPPVPYPGTGLNVFNLGVAQSGGVMGLGGLNGVGFGGFPGIGLGGLGVGAAGLGGVGVTGVVVAQ